MEIHNQSTLRIPPQEARPQRRRKVLRLDDAAAAALRRAHELHLVLEVDVEREDVPAEELLCVGGGEPEGGYLALWKGRGG